MSIIELWWLSLAIFAIVVVVVAVLLGLIIAAAKSIDRYTYAIWTVGKQIAGNTVSIWMLEKTNSELESITNAVQEMDRSVASLDSSLGALAESSSRRG